jgi:hypothetical protein
MNMSKIEMTKTGGFRAMTLAWVTRNGVTIRCYGRDCTWQDDPLVTQSLTLPDGEAGGVERFSTDDAAPVVGVDVSPDQFREIVRRMGGRYERTTATAGGAR